MLTMQQVLVGVLLPLVVSVASGAVAAARPPAAPEQPAAAAAGPGRRRAPAWWRGACGAAARAWRAWGVADSALASLLVGDGGADALQLAVCAWLLLGNIWMVVSAAMER